MKKFFLLAALMCGTSFASMASSTSSPDRNSVSDEITLMSEVSEFAPTVLVTDAFTANGHIYLVVYDNEIEGDFAAALEAAIAYAAGGGGTPGCYGGKC